MFWLCIVLVIGMTTAVSAQDATPLVFDERTDGTIDSTHHEDLYSFEAQADTYLIIDYTSSSFDIPTLTLSPPSNETLLTLSPFSFPEPVLLHVTTEGSYTIMVADENATSEARYGIIIHEIDALTNDVIQGTYTAGDSALFYLVATTEAAQTLHFEVTDGTLNTGISILEMDSDGSLAEQTRIASLALTHVSIGIPTENYHSPAATDYFVIQLSPSKAMLQQAGATMSFSLSLTTDEPE